MKDPRPNLDTLGVREVPSRRTQLRLRRHLHTRDHVPPLDSVRHRQRRRRRRGPRPPLPRMRLPRRHRHARRLERHDKATAASGRTAPMRIARDGEMNATEHRRLAQQRHRRQHRQLAQPVRHRPSVWTTTARGDPPAVQYRNWCCTATAFLDALGAPGAGHVIDHAASTNRKVDLTASRPHPRPRPLDGRHRHPTRPAPRRTDRRGRTTRPRTATPALAGGYYILTNIGDVYTYGNARYRRRARQTRRHPPHQPARPAVHHADPDPDGYWIGVADGGVFSFDAPFYGSATNDFPN